ncbi:MAG: hypothetical protein N2712_07875, partial [Brevinematales bacterium]|nr:hypothetical protein [Brevinematales bacterium]
MSDIYHKIESLIQSFSISTLSNILADKNFTTYTTSNRLYQLEDKDFVEIHEVGYINMEHSKNLKAFAIKTLGEITERSSKKKQYDKAKEILKTLNTEYGIFAFYDEI